MYSHFFSSQPSKLALRPSQTFPLVNPDGLDLHNVKAEAAEYLGHKALRLTVESQTADSGLGIPARH